MGDGVKLNGRDYDRHALARHAGDLTAAGGVRSVVLDDGTERGIRTLEFRTGAGLSFDVLVDRAMDLGGAEFLGAGSAGAPRPGSATPACTSTATTTACR